MSIFGSLTTGISGLQAQAAALGHISDNIANARTSGYKRVDTAFNSLVLQSNARVHNPGGVVARPNFANNVAGNIETVDRTTNLALRGQGFFSVSRLTEVNGRTVPTEERFYTRDGSFELNEERIMVNKSGFALNGFVFNETTGAYATTAAPIQVTADIDSPVATRNIDLRANLPTDPTPGQPIQPTTIQIYDASGTPRTLTLGWRPGQNPDSWRLTIDAPGARGNLPLAGELPGFPVSATSTSLTPGRYDRPQIEEVQFTAPGDGGIKIGDNYVVLVNGVEFSQSITTNNASQLANLTGVAQALADQVNAAVPPTGVTATVVNGRLRLTAATAGEGFTVDTRVNNGAPTANAVSRPATTAATASSVQQTSVSFSGSNIDIGDIYTINVDNGVTVGGTTTRTYAITVTAANVGQLRDLNGVVSALAARINANSPTENVIASASGSTLTLRGTTAGDAFNVGEQAGTTTTAASPTAAQVTELSYPNRPPEEGDTLSVTVAGATVSVTLTAADIAANPTMNDVLTNVFLPAITADATISAAVTPTVSGTTLVLTGNAVNAPFTVGARDTLMGPSVDNAPGADNTAFVSTLQNNVSGTRQTQRISLTGVPGDVGSVYSVTLRSPTPIQDEPTMTMGRLEQRADASNPQVSRIGYNAADASAEGETYRVTINGTTVSVTLSAAQAAANTTVGAVLDNLLIPAISANATLGALLTPTRVGNDLVLTGSAANTPFTVTDAGEQSTEPSSMMFDFSAIGATPTVGDRYAVTANGSTYSLLITDQNIANFPDRDAVLNDLVTQINNDFGAPFTATALTSGGNTDGIYLTAKQATTVLDPTQEVFTSFSKTVTYETNGEEVSLDEIAGKLALKINQEGGMPLQASSIGGVVTLTGNLDGLPFFATPVATVGRTPPHIGLTFGGLQANGNLAPAGTLSSMSAANVGTGNATVSAVTETGAPAQISFTVDYGNGPQRVSLNIGNFAQPSGLTQFDGEAINVTSLLQDGSPQGTFRDVEIRENGDVVANYDNGRRRTIARVPVVLFNNANALARETGNVFTETADSGRARFTETGLNGAGVIAASSLEGSNVDIAQEFTKLIVAQRSYTANTRVITTTDEMLTETINLKR